MDTNVEAMREEYRRTSERFHAGRPHLHRRLTELRKAIEAAARDAYTRGTAVEYFHVASQAWRPATVQGFRASESAYVLTTEHGTDAAPALWTRLVETTTVHEASRETAKAMDRHADCKTCRS